MQDDGFWEEEEQVERFAGREPDHRLARLIEDYRTPAQITVLDIGCAGGRNTDLLASRGFDVFALDASAAMVGRTRERVAGFLGAGEAERRVRPGTMEDLSEFASSSFDLVVALGVFHSATTDEQWHAALSEAARVLAPQGKMIVAVFDPETSPSGGEIKPVPGEPNVYEGFRPGRHYLVGPAVLDAEMARRGLETVEPTQTVVVPVDSGQRVTINALYRKVL